MYDDGDVDCSGAGGGNRVPKKVSIIRRWRGVCLFAKILQIPVFRLHLRTRSQPGSVVGFDPFLADGQWLGVGQEKGAGLNLPFFWQSLAVSTEHARLFFSMNWSNLGELN